MTSTSGDQSKPVTGYPPGYPHPQANYHTNAAYPQAQPTYPATTTYPYAAAPPAAYYHSNAYAPPPYDSRGRNFLRSFIIALIALFIIFGIITFITWLVLRPRLPVFRVDSVSVSSLNASSASELSATWDVTFFVRNPNKKVGVSYDRLESSVFYRGDILSHTWLSPFAQGRKNETKVEARFAALSAYVGQGPVKEMLDDRSRGAVDFNVKVLCWVRFRTGAWTTRRRLLRVFCDGLKVGFSSKNGSGSLLGGSRECEVDL